jgi:L-amino acid N-acyltransferase YncA
MNNIYTRKATLEDREIIWQWWNDPLTRKMMKLNEPVAWDVHVKWFDNTINSDKRILFISLEGSEKLGVVRFDLRDAYSYEVSINLNPKYRAKGYGSKILNLSIQEFLKTDVKVKKLFAMFKKINVASKKTFLSNNFILVNNPDKFLVGLERFDIETEEYCEYIYDKNKET